ncbi:MAG: NYN domain-containing protein [Clostridiales bacterium]|jgi:uncharacterized LabA/DUF88 family protein|nr:NYN domain-containing protein [Clostridiales bacterium]
MPVDTAVFFDFENFEINTNFESFMERYQEQFVGRIKEVTGGGDFAFIKVYANWYFHRYKAITSFLLENGMEAVQVFGYSSTQTSKNIADFMMSLDMLETAYTKPFIHNFVAVTGDAGFSIIVNKLKALGKNVIVYRPELNYSRYLEKIANSCIGMEPKIIKAELLSVPASDKRLIISHAFTTADLPNSDKINPRIMQPDYLKKLDAYGLATYDECNTLDDIKKIILSMLRVLTVLNLYDNHPQIVASISLIALLAGHYIKDFSVKNYGKGSLVKLLEAVTKDTDYRLERKDKIAQYYIVISEDGLRNSFPDLVLEQEITKPASIEIVPSAKPITVKYALTDFALPESDKLNAKFMQPDYLAKIDGYGLQVCEDNPEPQDVYDMILALLRILTVMNLYEDYHPQIITSISLLSLIMEHYVKDFKAKNYGHTSLGKMLELILQDTEFRIARKNKKSPYYIVISKDGLRNYFSDIIFAPDGKTHANAAAADTGLSEIAAVFDGSETQDVSENAVPEDAAAEKDKQKTDKPEKGKKSRQQSLKQANRNNSRQNRNRKHLPMPDEGLTAVNGAVLDAAPQAGADTAPLPAAAPPTVIKDEINGDDSLSSKPAKSKKQNADIKMNDYIRSAIELMLNKNLISGAEFEKLLNEDFCAENFGINYPLLKEVGSPFFSNSEIYVGKQKVYFKRVFKQNGRYFLIYGNWKDKDKTQKFIEWTDANLYQKLKA